MDMFDSEQPVSASQSSRTQHGSAREYTPLPLAAVGDDGARRRHLLRHVTEIFAIAISIVSWVTLARFLAPTPEPPTFLMSAALACPILLFLAGVFLIRSVRAGLGLSAIALIAAIAMTARWFQTGQSDSASGKLLFVAVMVVPPAIATWSTIVLYRLRRFRVQIPIV